MVEHLSGEGKHSDWNNKFPCKKNASPKKDHSRSHSICLLCDCTVQIFLKTRHFLHVGCSLEVSVISHSKGDFEDGNRPEGEENDA